MMDINYKLSGQYRYTIITDNRPVYSSNWTRNTILSSGLTELYSKSIPEILNNLSLGQSSALPGTQGYNLSGVITPSNFINIPRADFQSYTDISTPSVRTYYTTFSISTSSTPSVFREFAIMSTPRIGFARNVFPDAVVVPENSILNFEYQLVVDWTNSQTTSILVQNISSNTFNLPLSVTTYNIPGDKVFYPNAQIILNQYTGALPLFGSDFWSASPNWGITTGSNSTFSVSQILTSIDNGNRKFIATTVYSGISAPINSGFNSNINSFNVVLDGNVNIKTNSFVYCRFAYPLSVYNLTSVVSSVSYTQRNILNLTLRYSWAESV
jgi:hypothetical protein